MKILLVEDDELFRFGLTVAIQQSAELDLVDTCTDGRTVLNKVQKHQPEMVLIDLVLPGVSGIEAIRQIKSQYPDIKVLVLTSHSESTFVDEAIKAGADGFCLKGLSSDRLFSVIKEVMQGVFWLDASIADYIKKRLSQEPDSTEANGIEVSDKNLNVLTDRERTVLDLLAEGKRNQEIADLLCISVATVRAHTHAIFKKLDFKDRTMAALFMQRMSQKEP